jgi:hypothetical protein
MSGVWSRCQAAANGLYSPYKSPETSMARQSILIVVFGLLTVAGCEPTAEQNAAAGEEVAVLPGTESSKNFGDYVVHFNALATDQLTPGIAQQYGIVRSQNRAMLNVSILRQDGDASGSARAVTGSVSASAVNLNGQLKSVPLREIREEDAVYYIGEIAITNAETLIFTVDVTPINEASRFTVRFMKQFYVD